MRAPAADYLPRILLAGMLLLPSASPATCWRPVPDSSELAFGVPQAGNVVRGHFRAFQGVICLDAADAHEDRAEIEVETGSVDTGLPELDEILRGDLFFASARWPHARFTSGEIRKTGAGRYETRGDFTIRDRTRNVPVTFTLADDAESGLRVNGELTIDRREFDVGLEEWRDSELIGDNVTIQFSVLLTPVMTSP